MNVKKNGVEYKLEYTLLDNGKGIIISRQPLFVVDEPATDELLIVFRGAAPADATAIFELPDGITYYRPINEPCKLPLSKLLGMVKVTVARLNGQVPLQRWPCESFRGTQHGNCMLIEPADMDLPQEVVYLRLEVCELRRAVADQRERYEELSNRLDRIMEGYDLT